MEPWNLRAVVATKAAGTMETMELVEPWKPQKQLEPWKLMEPWNLRAVEATEAVESLELWKPWKMRVESSVAVSGSGGVTARCGSQPVSSINEREESIISVGCLSVLPPAVLNICIFIVKFISKIAFSVVHRIWSEHEKKGIYKPMCTETGHQHACLLNEKPG